MEQVTHATHLYAAHQPYKNWMFLIVRAAARLAYWYRTAPTPSLRFIQDELRNEAYNFFLDHVRNENFDGKLHQCAKRIDEISFPSKFSFRTLSRKKI
jgi:hypothetical protein